MNFKSFKSQENENIMCVATDVYLPHMFPQLKSTITRYMVKES